jgi:hypothetical protein
MFLCTDSLLTRALRRTPGYVAGSPLNYLDSVTFCSDGSVCCGYGNTECCNAGQGHAQIVYGQTALIPSSTGAVLSSYYSGVHVSTVSITGTSSTPSSQTSGSQIASSGSSSLMTQTSLGFSMTYAPQSSNVSTTLSHSVGGLSQGTKIGLGVGIAVGAPLLITVAVVLTCLYVKRKYRHAQHENVAPHKDEQQPPYELPRNTWSPAELHGIPKAAEMNVE